MTTINELSELERELYDLNVTHNYYDNPDKIKLLAAVMIHNKGQFKEAISDYADFRYKYDIERVLVAMRGLFGNRYRLYKATQGIQESIEANIDGSTAEIAEATRIRIYVPGAKDMFASITIRNYVKVGAFQNKLRMIESLLKRAKIRYNKTFKKINNINTVQLETTKLEDNERFWGTLRLLGK